MNSVRGKWRWIDENEKTPTKRLNCGKTPYTTTRDFRSWLHFAIGFRRRVRDLLSASAPGLLPGPWWRIYDAFETARTNTWRRAGRARVFYHYCLIFCWRLG